MRILAEHFHPARGHVYDGAILMFPNGKEYVVSSTIQGWVLKDQKGMAASMATNDADVLTSSVVSLLEENAIVLAS